MYRNDSLRPLQCLLLCSVLVAGYGCAERQTPWERITRTGQLRFATIANPVTCYRTSAGYGGIEYELARRFADDLGVGLTVILAPNPHTVMTMVARDQADIGGAGLLDRTAGPVLDYGPAYYQAALQLVYHSGNPRPLNIDSLGQDRIPVSTDRVALLRRAYPHVRWQEIRDSDTATLLRMVQAGRIKATVADTYQVNFYRHLYPDLRVAFRLTGPQPATWIYRHDDALAVKIDAFIREQADNGTLERLLEQYFGHVSAFDANAVSTFLAMGKKRLPLYEELFRETAKRYGMDWTLLAAMSYQESHWHPEARSPTGVRGLMMLTEGTAGDLGVVDRVDPPQSVDGGARYFHAILDKIPARISDPDRTWFALAAYNIGFQHLEDTRILTRQLGGDPDRWRDVRKNLPLLEDDKWHVRTLYGKARGGEAVRYVRNIRIYQDILRWTFPGRKKTEYVQRDAEAWIALAPVNLQAM